MSNGDIVPMKQGPSGGRWSRRILVAICLTVTLVRGVSADDSSSALQQMVSDVHFYTLDNGLKVILYNRGTAPVFAGAVVVRVGGSDEVVGQTGISHLFEHMAFKGTQTVGTKDYAREKELLERLEAIAATSSAAQELSDDQKKAWEETHAQLRSIWISDDFTRRYEQQGAVGQNATTDKEFTKYFVNLPRSAFEFWCKMEADRLLNPVMRQFYQERDVVLEERRMRFEDDPGGRLYELLLGVAYQRHPYRAPVIGYEQDLKGITATNLEAFRRKYYVPSNMVVSIVGRIDPDADMKVIRQYFGALPAAPSITRNILQESAQEGERRVSVKLPASPQIVIAYRKPNYPDPDDAPISVMAEILSGGRISPLYTELVKRRQLTADISHDEGPGVAYPNLLMFDATVKAPHTTQAVLEAFDTVITRFRRTGATAEQLEIAKRSIGMDYLGHLQSNQSLALDFASSELVYGSWKASVEWYDQVMKVSLDDIKRVAEKYLVPENRTIGTVERAQ
jgi:predicted Zn-dependent peptidase